MTGSGNFIGSTTLKSTWNARFFKNASVTMFLWADQHVFDDQCLKQVTTSKGCCIVGSATNLWDWNTGSYKNVKDEHLMPIWIKLPNDTVRYPVRYPVRTVISSISSLTDVIAINSPIWMVKVCCLGIQCGLYRRFRLHLPENPCIGSLTVHIKLSVQLRLHSAKVAFVRFLQIFILWK